MKGFKEFFKFKKLPNRPWRLSRDKEFNFENWQLKRSLTTKIFILECVMLGMEYSVTFLTLWLYLNTLVNTDYPKVFYSLVSSAYLLACVVFSVFVGRYVDRSRKVRLTFITCNTLVIIGNLVYALHFSPWFLVLGRLISGTDGPLRSVITGEIARSYPDSEILGKFSLMGMAFSLGFIIGPGINFIFTGVDFWIGTWHITYVNVPGIYMAFLFTATQIIVIFGLSDLSREFDFKKESVAGKFQESNVKVSHFEIEKSNVPKKHQTNNKFERSIQQRFDLTTSITNNTIDETTPFLKFGNSNCFYEQSLQTSITLHENSIEGSMAASTNKSRNLGAESSIENTKSLFATTLETSVQGNKKALAYEKLEQSALLSQSFGMSNFFVTASTLYLLKNEQKQMDKSFEFGKAKIPTMSSVLSQMLSNVDVMLVLFLTLALWYWMVAFDMWLPILVVDVLKYGITELNGIVFAFGVFSAVILFIISAQTFSDRTLFNFAMVSMAALSLMETIFIIFRTFALPLAVNTILWIVWGTLFAIVVVMDEVFLVGVLSKMVNSNIQTFTESVRLAMSRLGALLALLTSALVFEWLVYVCIAAIIFSFVALGLLIWRRKSLRAPTICIR